MHSSLKLEKPALFVKIEYLTAEMHCQIYACSARFLNTRRQDAAALHGSLATGSCSLKKIRSSGVPYPNSVEQNNACSWPERILKLVPCRQMLLGGLLFLFVCLGNSTDLGFHVDDYLTRSSDHDCGPQAG